MKKLTLILTLTLIACSYLCASGQAFNRGPVREVKGVKVDYGSCWARNEGHGQAIVVPYYDDLKAYLINYDSCIYCQLPDSLITEYLLSQPPEIRNQMTRDAGVNFEPLIINNVMIIGKSSDKIVDNICGWDCQSYRVICGKASYEIFFTRGLGYDLTPLPRLSTPKGVVLRIKQIKGGDFFLQALSVNQLY